MKSCQVCSFFAICILIFAFTNCAATSEPSVSPPQYWPTDGWNATTAEAQGVDSATLAEMLEHIDQANYAIDSVHVVRNGSMVLEAFIYPFGPGMKHLIHSCTKSIVSVLIGIAIDEGLLKGLNQRVLDIFPDRKVQNLSSYKKKLTLEHLLTMTTGLRSEDSYLYRWRGLSRMRRSDDWVQHILDLPSEVRPGLRFDYSNMASFLLSSVIHEKTGISAVSFGLSRLFTPLGISDFMWPENPQGINIGWGELRMLPEDLAKIGLLYLQGVSGKTGG